MQNHEILNTKLPEWLSENYRAHIQRIKSIIQEECNPRTLILFGRIPGSRWPGDGKSLHFLVVTENNCPVSPTLVDSRIAELAYKNQGKTPDFTLHFLKVSTFTQHIPVSFLYTAAVKEGILLHDESGINPEDINYPRGSYKKFGEKNSIRCRDMARILIADAEKHYYEFQARAAAVNLWKVAELSLSALEYAIFGFRNCDSETEHRLRLLKRYIPETVLTPKRMESLKRLQENALFDESFGSHQRSVFNHLQSVTALFNQVDRKAYETIETYKRIHEEISLSAPASREVVACDES